MATISTPEQALHQISELTKNKDNPNDPGLIMNLGAALLSASSKLRDQVERSGGKAQKGSVTVTIPLHFFRDPNKETKCKGGFKIGMKLPSEYSTNDFEFFVGDEGELSTSPLAPEQKKLFTPAVIEGGRPTQNVEPKQQGRKAE